MPESPASADARRKAVAPVVEGRIPTSRAPTRLTAVARSALPVSVRSKNKKSRKLKIAELATIKMLWPETLIEPRSKEAWVIGSGREPPGPTNKQARPDTA